ncbi:MAG: acetyltransferase [Candidatus Bathyarchaeota archaeon]|nr:acetyltransferase [Candidatus Bathyarchaeota archaeon]
MINSSGGQPTHTSKQKLVIIGDGETAELAYDYFSGDSNFEVVAFSIEEAFMHQKTLLGLPVVAFEKIEQKFNPNIHHAFVAVSFTQLNRLRSRLCKQAKAKGYRLASYISPKASVAGNVEIGENCFIQEHVSIQRGAKIGANVTIWVGSCIGHRSVIGENCFLASHVAVSGFCRVGENCFLGVNCCLAGNVKIGDDCVLGAGAVVTKNLEGGKVYVGNPAKPLGGSSVEAFICGEKTL